MRRARVASLLLATLILEVPPVEAQAWRCGGHTIEWVGGAPVAGFGPAPADDPTQAADAAAGTTSDGSADSSGRGRGPAHEDGSQPSISEPAGMDRQLWDGLVFNASDRPTGIPPDFRPPALRQTLVTHRTVVPTIGICVQGPTHSDFGKRVQPYANHAWWREQILRWTGLAWSGQLRVGACTGSPIRGWIYVREAARPLPFGVLARAGTVREEHPHFGGRWVASELNWRQGLEDVSEAYFEASLAHELGHALGFFHVPQSSGFVMSTGSTSTWPEEESSMAQLAYRVGPNVRYPGVVREVDPVDSAENNPDRRVLIALHDSTGGQNWTDNTNWGTAAPLERWHGVSTDAGGRVNWLELHHNNLSGPIPAELGSLSSLEKLDFENNNLSGPLPAELGSLSSLKYLNLLRNDLSGPIPPELGGLSELTVLFLNSNDLSGEIPPELGRMKRLRRLYLRGNDLHGRIPVELTEIPDLDLLDLRRNALTGSLPPELGNLHRLRNLWLRHNQLSGPVPPELGRMSRLRSIGLDHNRLSGPLPASFTNLTALLGLRIQENDGLCAPADDEFQAWLATLELFEGPICGEQSVPVLPALALLLAALLLGGVGALRIFHEERRR